jgi:ketosteroid isomerase-like protein
LSANLDLVRSIYADWERGDYTTLDWVHPEIEYVIADGPAPGTWRGLVGMAQSYNEWLGAWETFRIEAEDYREIDNERVLVFTYYSGRAKTSQGVFAPMREPGANLFQIRDGKVTRLVGYWDRDRALADLGLTPESEAP